jgi:hypothetical protein
MPAPSVEAHYMAAVKAGGEGAVLSGRAAAYLLKLIKGKPPKPEITTPRQRNIPSLLTRCCKRLSNEDVTKRDGIPVTTPARTLVDLARDTDENRLAVACHEAGVKYRTTPRDVKAVLERYPNAPGRGKLWRIMNGDVRVALSKLERRFLQLLREAGLPLPVTNRLAGGRRVDCRWPDYRLTVELISFRYHHSRYAWEKDHSRKREAYARGDEFRDFTYGDVFDNPERVLAELRPLLAASRLASSATAGSIAVASMLP